MSNPFATTPVIPNHFDLNFLLNPTNRPLFARAFSLPEHEYLEEQFYAFCEIQDSIARLDRLMKFTIENLKQRGISALIFTIKDLRTPSSSSSSYHTPPESNHVSHIERVVVPNQHHRRIFLRPKQPKVRSPTLDYPLDYNRPFDPYASVWPHIFPRSGGHPGTSRR